MKAPERLLYHPDFTQQVVVSLPEGRASIPHTEYVRADLFADLEAEKQAQITDLALQCLVTDGQAAEALARAEKAEAERDKLTTSRDMLSNLWADEKIRADRAEAERDRIEWAAIDADGEIRTALPVRFVLVPPDGGNVKTLDAVKATVEALDRADALLKEAVEVVTAVRGSLAKITPMSIKDRNRISDAIEMADDTLAKIKEAKDNG